MDTHRALLNRRTVHDYRPDPVPREALMRALEAAHQAPCHKLTYPWRFVLIGPSAREKIAALSADLKAARAPASPEMRAKTMGKLLDPGVVMAVTCVKSPDPVRAREDYAAVACAIENMMLSFTADGLGSKWTTGAVTRAPQTYDLLGVDSEREEIVGFVLAGTPAKAPDVPPRPTFRQYVREIP